MYISIKFLASGLHKCEMDAFRNISQEGVLWSAFSYAAESCVGISAFSTVEGMTFLFAASKHLYKDTFFCNYDRYSFLLC